MAGRSILSAELALYEAHRTEWCRSHPGEYVVIQDQTVAGFFATYADALKVGLEKFGVRREFLVKQVWLNDPVYVVS